MENRIQDLSKLNSSIHEIDKELTMILQSLQWDRNSLLQTPPLETCKYETNHKVPLKNKNEHESRCFLKKYGYSNDDKFLPEAFDPNADTIVNLTHIKIQQIIRDASQCDPSFKRGVGCEDPQPLTAERLQAEYTADERRAIYDAVVATVPSCDDLSQLALISDANGEQRTKPKTKLEILAELRNMKRRRTKYRVAAKTKNYSDVLRDVIKTQMELYTEATEEVAMITTAKYEETQPKRYYNLTHEKIRHTSSHLENQSYPKRKSFADQESNKSEKSKYFNENKSYDRHTKNSNKPEYKRHEKLVAPSVHAKELNYDERNHQKNKHDKGKEKYRSHDTEKKREYFYADDMKHRHKEEHRKDKFADRCNETFSRNDRSTESSSKNNRTRESYAKNDRSSESSLRNYTYSNHDRESSSKQDRSTEYHKEAYLGYDKYTDYYRESSSGRHHDRENRTDRKEKSRFRENSYETDYKGEPSSSKDRKRNHDETDEHRRRDNSKKSYK